MKKIFTLTTALATVAAANAIQKVNSVVSYDQAGEKMEFVVKNAQKVERAKSMTAKSEKTDLKAAAETSRANANVNPLYAYPNGTFYSYIGIDAANGLFTYPGSVILPAYVNNEWLNMSWYLNNGRPTPATEESYKWETIVGENVVNSATTFNYTVLSDPSLRAGYGQNTPVLTCGDKTYQAGTQGNNGFNPSFVEYGGYGKPDPELLSLLTQYLTGQTGQINEFTSGSSFIYNRYSDDFLMNNVSFACDYPGTEEEPIETFYLENGETVNDIKVVGFCQNFPAPAAPYALSSLSLDVNTTCSANAKLQFDFFKVDKNVVDDTPLYSYTYTFAEANNNADLTITIPFTTEDEIGDEINYVLIDSEVMMVVSGFTDPAFKVFAPHIAFFNYDRTFSTYCPEPRNFYAFVADKEGASFRDTGYIAGWTYQTTGETIWTTYSSMAITVEAEYPYIKPLMNIVTEEEYDPSTEIISVGLSNDEPETAIAVLCPGDVENVTCSTITGDDIPSWLVCEVVSAAEFEADDNGPSDIGQKYFYVYLGLADNAPATPVNCYVKLEYKGQSTVMFVTTGDPAGIDNVTAAEAAELDWNAPVYNVMGQKVSQGYTGIAIQNGKKFIVK